MNRANLPRSLPVLTLFLVSGATGLLYEIVWLRQLILIFGSTLFATSTVLSVFMGGLALGAFLGGRLVKNREVRPLRLYGYLEIGIGLYAVAVPFFLGLLSPVYRLVWNAGGADSFLLLSLAKFVGIAAVLLLPTVLMGASLPVLARQVADDPLRIGGQVGALYAVNALGAVAGTFIAGFIAIPLIGVRNTVWATAFVNVTVGLVAAAAAGRLPHPRTVAAAAHPSARPPEHGRVRVALIAFGISGFVAMVLEVAWTRGLATVMGSSVYAFTLMLLAFLVGLAAGSAVLAAALRRWARMDAGTVLAALLGSAGALAYATAYLLQVLPRLFAEAYLRWQPSPNGMFAIELLLGLLVMFPTTFALGGIFPTVLQIHARTLEGVPGSVGTVYASNTLGTILGAFAGGFLLIPWLGVRDTLIAVSALEIGLGLWVAWKVAEHATGRAALVVATGFALVVLPLLRPGWDDLLMNSGVYYYIQDVPKEKGWDEFVRRAHEDRKILYLEEGLTSTVIVVDQPRNRNRYLAVNGKVEASSSSDVETQLMCAHLPLLLHPAPKDALVVGLASGITVGAAATHPLERIRVVEVEKAIVGAARLFSEFNGNVLEDPRLSLSINDARNELEFSPRRYDVIVSEPSNPFMTVAANLFTEEFFRLAKSRLRPGGIFSQWVQAYCMPPEDLRSVIAAFRAAFPRVMLFQIGGVDLILLGSEQRLRFDLAELGRRMSELKVLMDLGRVGVREPMDLLPLLWLGDAEIDTLVEGAPRNTDDNARVEYSAPKAFALHTTSLNWDMLEEHVADPLEYVTPPVDAEHDWARLVLDLAGAWLRRDEPVTAEDYARQALDGPFHAEAEAFLSRLPDPAPSP